MLRMALGMEWVSRVNFLEAASLHSLDVILAIYIFSSIHVCFEDIHLIFITCFIRQVPGEWDEQQKISCCVEDPWKQQRPETDRRMSDIIR